MRILGFGKRIKNRSFDYVPRHYDPAKEELEERLKRYKINDAGDPELAKQRIRGGFRRQYGVTDDFTRKSQRRSIKILLMTLMVLLLLCYVFITKYLPRIVEALAN